MPGHSFKRGWIGLTLVAVVAGWFLVVGCQATGDKSEQGSSIGAYRDRMIARQQEQTSENKSRRAATATPVSWQSDLPERETLLVQPAVTEQPAPAEVLAELPDPTEAPDVLQARLDRLRNAPRPDMRVIRNYEKVVSGTLEELKMIERPQQIRLTLAECIQRALEHNYAIRYEAYNPAISQTELVEAEAAFDAAFFLESGWNTADQAVASELQASTTDTRSYQGGFRKLLPTGMQVSTSLQQRRTYTNFQYQTLNPAYNSSFVVAFTQPLLRNFGLDTNRARINIARAKRDIAYETFVQKVRDQLYEVERAYWRLAQARRTAAIGAEQVAQNKATYENMVERQAHDATEVELANSLNRWKQRQVEYQEQVKNVRDGEDALKNLLNDPEFVLSREIEIIPIDTPFAAALTLDQLAAVRTALESRSEIRQARRGIDQARINTAYTKNQTLPKLDLSFQYEVQGVDVSADASFDNLTTARFISYNVSASFEVPIGNRAARAAHARARHQEHQAIVGLHQVTDGIVQEVNGAVRTLNVRYAQIPPQLEAVQAADRNLRALQARTQRIDPTYLDSELGAVERLASARGTLLGVIADYNIAIAALEKSKGTLLEYNNVVVTDEPPDR